LRPYVPVGTKRTRRRRKKERKKERKKGFTEFVKAALRD
jgi:hypothetical protein